MNKEISKISFLLIICLGFSACANQNKPVIHTLPDQSSKISLTAADIKGSTSILLDLPMNTSLMDKKGMQAKLLSELDSAGRGREVNLPLAEPDFDNKTVRVAIDTQHLDQAQEYLLLVRTTHKYFNPNRRYFLSIGE